MKVRNILFLVLASLLLCTAVSAAEYTDVSDTHWAYKQIDYLSAEITGYPDGSYKPEKSVSRAEFLTLFARIAFPDEWKRVEGEEWWKSAYEVCTAHDLLNNITGSRSEAMLRGEIAALLERFCSGWGGCLDHISRIWVRIKLKIMMTIELATTALVEAAPTSSELPLA